MMDLGALLSAVLAVTTVVAAGFAGLALGTTKTLREAVGDLRERMKDKDAQILEQDKQIALLKVDKDALARIVTGEVHWEALEDLLQQHHRESMAAWEKIQVTIREVRGAG